MEKRDYEKLYKSLIDYIEVLRDDFFEHETNSLSMSSRNMRMACDRILKYSNDLLNIKAEIKNVKSPAPPFNKGNLYTAPPF